MAVCLPIGPGYPYGVGDSYSVLSASIGTLGECVMRPSTLMSERSTFQSMESDLVPLESPEYAGQMLL